MTPLWSAAISLLVAFITILGGILSYNRQKAADRFNELVRVRQEHYRSYLFAIQRVLTSCVRTDQATRRDAIDDFRSFEAALYVAAPYDVAAQLPRLHSAFFDYTRCIRCLYEERQFQKFGSTHSPDRLVEFENLFLEEYRRMVRCMRRDTLGDDNDVTVTLSLASKEATS